MLRTHAATVNTKSQFPIHINIVSMLIAIRAHIRSPINIILVLLFLASETLFVLSPNRKYFYLIRQQTFCQEITSNWKLC